jgi:hypothetical protein
MIRFEAWAKPFFYYYGIIDAKTKKQAINIAAKKAKTAKKNIIIKKVKEKRK